MKSNNLVSRSFFISFVVILAFFVMVFAKDVAKAWVAPASAAKIENPLKQKKTDKKLEQKLYAQQCATCHGKKGKGDGPAAKYLGTKVSNLTSDKVQKQTDGEIFWKITHGKSPMPTFKSMLTDEQRWELVNYIRTLSSK